MKQLRVKDLYPDPFEKNLINQLYILESGVLNPFPAVINEKNAISIGADYCFNHSFNKPLSPLLNAYLSSYVVDDNLEYVVYKNKKIVFDVFVDLVLLRHISNILEARYKDKWLKMYSAIISNYDLLKPYSVTVEDNITLDTMDTDTTNSSSKHQTNDKNSIYPFNLSGDNNPVPLDQSSSDLVYEDKSKYSRNAQNKRTLSRGGNIGNKQQIELIAMEWKVRQEKQLLDIIFDDLDEVLTSNLY